MDFDGFIALLRDEGASPETLKAYSSDLEHLARFLQEKKLRVTQVDREVVSQWKNHMQNSINPRFSRTGLKTSTIKRRCTVASSFFDYLCSLNPRIKNPFRFRVGRKIQPKSKDGKVQPIDDLSLNTLLSEIDNARDRALISLFVTSGLRLSEVWQLDIATISKVEEDCDDGSTRIWGTGRVIGKGTKERTFYFDAITVSLIDDYLRTRNDSIRALFISERKQRLSRRAIQDVLSTWCRRLGLRVFHIHQLRHYYASKLAEAKIDGLALRNLLGHANYDTTLGYISMAESSNAVEYFAAMERARLR